jgi:hypothetical protein
MNKQIVYLSISAVVLLLVYILMQASAVPEAKNEQLADVDTSLVEQVTIASDGSTVTLQRGEDGWMVTEPYEYRANQSFVKTLLDKLEDLRIEAEVTSKSSRHGEFEVTDEQAIQLTIQEGGDTHEILLGKAAQGFKQTYARRAGKDQVYLIRGGYGVAVKRQPDAWRDKKITQFKQEDVLAVDLPNIDLQKEGETWKAITPGGEEFTPDEAKVKRVTRALANLRTSDFPPAADYQGTNWDRPRHTFVVQLADGGERRILLFPVKDEENRFFLRYGDEMGLNDTVYRIYTGVINTLLWEEDDLSPAAEDAA